VIRGILNINKPSGISSYDVIRIIKRIIKGNAIQPNGKETTQSGSSCPRRVDSTKIGHAGTLDPMANGVLLILFNEATKIASFLTEQKKEYQAEIKLGIKTDTDDITGKVIQEKEVLKFTPAQIEESLQEFRGEITQIPPAYSALRQQGKRFYDIAREGKPVEPRPRKLTIYTIELLEANLPYLKIRAIVSKGTYIRSLARDIGDRLGCGATLQALTRTRIGSFSLNDALNIDELNYDAMINHLLPILKAMDNLDSVYIKETAEKKLLTGQAIKNSELFETDLGQLKTSRVKVFNKNHKIMAIATRHEGFLKPIRLIYADLSSSN